MQYRAGLPTGAVGMAAGYTALGLRNKLKLFEQQTNCPDIANWTQREDRTWLYINVPDSHDMLFQLWWADITMFMRWEQC